MIVLPVPGSGTDVTWIVVGMSLGVLGLFLLTAAWWQEANRVDRIVFALAAHDGELADLRGDVAAISTWLGIDITPVEDYVEPTSKPPDNLQLAVDAASPLAPTDTDEIPAQPETEPSDLPLQVHAALIAAQPEPADDWLRAFDAKWDAEMAEMRARWDAA